MVTKTAKKPVRSSVTPRELDVAKQVALGQTNGEIGVILKISPETVKVHVRSLLRKFECPRRGDLVEDRDFRKLLGTI